MAPPICPANAHEHSLCFVITFFIEPIGRRVCFVLFVIHGGAVFFVYILYSSWCLIADEKEGAGNFFMSQ